MVEFAVHGPVAVITLDRAAARNAIDGETAAAIESSVDRIEDDEDIWVGVITGRPPVFCAGADLKATRAGAGKAMFTRRGGFAGFVARSRTKPVIAAVDGAALAGGMEIALACDLIVASTTSMFGLPEVKRSLLASGGGVFRLPRKVPPNLAMECILTGDPIDAVRAHQVGLVNRLCESGEAVATALALATQICAAAPVAVRESRKVALASEFAPPDEAWRLSREALRTVVHSADYGEGLDAFVQKRAPRWAGR